MNIKRYLGAQVVPLPVDRSTISGAEADRINGGAGAYLQGKERQEYYAKAVKNAADEIDADSTRMIWYVSAIDADGTLTLRSDIGFVRSGVATNEVRIVIGGDSILYHDAVDHNNIDNWIGATDLHLLKRQKLSLLKTIEQCGEAKVKDHLEGLVSWINTFQDAMVETFNLNPDDVYLSEDE